MAGAMERKWMLMGRKGVGKGWRKQREPKCALLL